MKSVVTILEAAVNVYELSRYWRETSKHRRGLIARCLYLGKTLCSGCHPCLYSFLECDPSVVRSRNSHGDGGTVAQFESIFNGRLGRRHLQVHLHVRSMSIQPLRAKKAELTGLSEQLQYVRSGFGWASNPVCFPCNVLCIVDTRHISSHATTHVLPSLIEARITEQHAGEFMSDDGMALLEMFPKRNSPEVKAPPKVVWCTVLRLTVHDCLPFQGRPLAAMALAWYARTASIFRTLMCWVAWHRKAAMASKTRQSLP